jgi:hypothetical protein
MYIHPGTDTWVCPYCWAGMPKSILKCNQQLIILATIMASTERIIKKNEI